MEVEHLSQDIQNNTKQWSLDTDVRVLENEIQQTSINKLMVLHPLLISKNFPSVAQKLKQTNA